MNIYADRTLGSPLLILPPLFPLPPQQRRRWPPLLRHLRLAPASAPLHASPGSSATASAPSRCPFPRAPRRSAVARSCHVAPQVDSSCSGSPCLFLAPPHIQESFSTSFIRSHDHISLLRLLLLSAPCRTTATLFARRRQPPTPPHTQNFVLYWHHYTPLKLHSQFFSIPSRSCHYNAAAVELHCHRGQLAPPPLDPRQHL
jgi:hypothetical protein